ncbi:MAG TPA: hypothetical protein VFZ27_10575 [Terriglobia bacterium]|nr:hypothetical protein [Terriglobia bacterium]
MCGKVQLIALVKSGTGGRRSLEVIAAAVFAALLLGASRSRGTMKPSGRVHEVWRLDLPFGNDLQRGSLLEDVSSSGTMLLRSDRYTLVLWRPGEIKPLAKISLPVRPKQGQMLSASTECKFGSEENRVLCVRGPWLGLEDVGAGKEIRHVIGTQDFAGLDWDHRKDGAANTVEGARLPSSPVVVSVNTNDGRIAVAYNTLKNPKILLFSADLGSTLASWQAAEYVQDLFWSPNGKSLGVLYFNAYRPFNRQGKWTGWHPERDLAGVPDVSIFNVSTGKQVLTFASAGVDAKAAFSPDGKLIYTIAHFYTGVDYGFGGWTKDTLRAFSSKTGKLVRTFEVEGTGVRNSFALSPDGHFIAASCTKDTRSDWYYLLRLRENLGGDVTAGFVILDGSSGRVIFREKRRMFGDVATGTLPLFFSAKSDSLVTEFGQPPDQLVAYHISR